MSQSYQRVQIVNREQRASDRFSLHNAVQVGARELRASTASAMCIQRAQVIRELALSQIQLSRRSNRYPTSLENRQHTYTISYFLIRQMDLYRKSHAY